MYTEAEAKEKWCPQIHDDTGRNPRIFNVDCLGSRCMAWRWIGAQGPEQQGYCGLAGKP